MDKSDQMELKVEDLPTKKQTFEDVIYGEEPTQEFLEEFNAINNSEISEEEVERQAMEFKPELEYKSDEIITPIAEEQSYKTSESNISSLVIIFLFIALVIVGYRNLIG